MSHASWSKDWTIGVRVWIDRRGESVLGEGRAELLDAIGKHHSITAAAKAVGMSYRRAWTLIQEINQAAGEPLVESAVGGRQGGGARLTERGAFAVGVYQKLQGKLQKSAASVLRRVVAPHGEADAACLHVAAAISLQEALGQILAAFALRRPAIRVRAVYGASNELAAHLLSGAPGDVCIFADSALTDELERAGRIAPRSRRTVAANSLVAIGGAAAMAAARLDDLKSAAVKRIALADPACPLGRCSKAYLESRGAYDELLPKVLHVDNSRAVLSAVASGAAAAGLAFANDVGDFRILFRVPRTAASPRYVAAVVAGGDHADEAGELVEFLASPAAARCFRRCGLRPAATRPGTTRRGRSR